MINCPNCKIKNVDGSKFCKRCGTILAEKNTVNRCPNGHIMDPSWGVCPICNKQDVPIIHDRYNIIQILGEGAFSIVYKAYDNALERHVALKKFRKIYDQPVLARIQREATIWSRIKHPNIVSLFDVFYAQKTLYIVLEYVDGQSLNNLIEDQYIGKIDKLISYAIDILEAISYLHTNDIIHRDIKPSNIIIEKNKSSAILTDFNTGRDIGKKRSRTLTGSGSQIGTLFYMAPEQSTSKDVDYLSDIYSAGVLFYEMLTGDLPYFGESDYEIISKKINEKPPSILDIRHSIPKPIAELIEKMLSVDKSERPSANESIDILKNILMNTNWKKIIEEDKIFEKKPNLLIRKHNDVDQLNLIRRKTIIENIPDAKPTGFFASDIKRFEELNTTVSFYRSHMDDDYTGLLYQATVSFWLWLLCVFISFLILIIGIFFVYKGDVTGGVITLIADLLVLFIQRLFKQREEYYHNQKQIKQKHLEFGSIWNLAVQSAEGIGDLELRSKKISEIIDALIKHVQKQD